MARSRSAGIALVIGTEYNDRDLRRLQNDLDQLKRKAATTRGPIGRLGASIKSSMGPAALAGGAAGALTAGIGMLAGQVVEFAKAGVEAAQAEETSVAQLENQLKNLNVAFDSDKLNKYVDDLQFATGVADTELRPALAKLVTATGDLRGSMSMLETAINASVGSGKSLDSVTTALTKAQNGNTTSLKRMFPAIDDVVLASGNMKLIQEELNRLYGGAAGAALDTQSGKLKLLKIALDEATEAFGTGLLQGMLGADGAAGDLTETIKELRPELEALGETLGGIIKVLGNWAKINLDSAKWQKDMLEGQGKSRKDLENLARVIAAGSTALDRYSEAWRNASRDAMENPLIPPATVDMYGAALGLQPTRFASVIQGLIDAAKAAREAADQENADAAAAAAEAAQRLAQRIKDKTRSILEDLQSDLEKAKAASKEFAEIRKGYIADAKADAAITTFQPQGPITGRGIAANIKQRLGLIKRFAAAITQLQGKLNGAALADIISQGPIAGLPYAEALIKDVAARKQVNALQAQLVTPAGTIGRIGAELATGTTAAALSAAETFTNKYVIGKDAIQITVNGEITAQTRRQLRQAVRDALSDVGREGKNGKKANIQ